ncbi:DinB family protein [Bacillus sp. FJAT-45350]|uniref:DinB family protein n=1 Tax=Bacillus sp. FJAT-45350 TaxID=2011014 RepID=UPI0015CE263D|nr:DinB family protein [Bacillus sp. FJAT-45350]
MLTAFTFVRNATQHMMKKVKEEQLDVVPENYSNSIRWNLGHILYMADNVLSHHVKYERVVPIQYKELFDMGTSPSNWTDAPPTKEELLTISERQMEAVQTLCKNQSSDTIIATPYEIFGTKFETVSDMVSFILFHEGMHFEKVKMLMKQTK